MDSIELRIIHTIDENRERIIEFARDVYSHPELGYKEFRTSAKVKEILEEICERTEDKLAVTGVKGYLKKEVQEINLALIGELDAVVSPYHPYADKETGACHACGHHAQLAGIIGAAIALSDENVKDALDGNVTFFAVPAEEYGEIEFKQGLKAQGIIRYGGGKSELIRIGAFEDVDISVVHHITSEPVDITVGGAKSNGFVSKLIRYTGKDSHAAAAPHKGINALNAASLGLSALAYHRETFQDSDSVRIHPIITKGGSLVNVVPGETVVETLVRARTIEAIEDAAAKTDRSFSSGAYALGAKIEIETAPGYLPVIPLPVDEDMFEAAKAILPEGRVIKVPESAFMTASTDVGDLTHIQPVLQFQTGGAEGELHSDKFRVFDEELSYINTAKIMALTAYRLLKDGGAKARKLKQDYQPRFTREEYIAYMDRLENTFERDFADER